MILNFWGLYENTISIFTLESENIAFPKFIFMIQNTVWEKI